VPSPSRLCCEMRGACCSLFHATVVAIVGCGLVSIVSITVAVLCVCCVAAWLRSAEDRLTNEFAVKKAELEGKRRALEVDLKVAQDDTASLEDRTRSRIVSARADDLATIARLEREVSTEREKRGAADSERDSLAAKNRALASEVTCVGAAQCCARALPLPTPLSPLSPLPPLQLRQRSRPPSSISISVTHS
jgi:hypothetical protein